MCSLRQASPQLFRVCESVALVDMIASFAQLATIRDYVRPEVTDTLALKAARHPVLDRVGDRGHGSYGLTTYTTRRR